MGMYFDDWLDDISLGATKLQYYYSCFKFGCSESVRGLPSYHHISMKNVGTNCYTTISL